MLPWHPFKLRFSFNFVMVLLFVLVLALGCSVASVTGDGHTDGPKTVNSSSRPKGDGQGITGIINFDNARARCRFSSLGENHFESVCTAVIFDEIGTETEVTSIANGVRLSWINPEKLMGSDLIDLSCATSSNALSQNCVLTLSQGTPTEMLFKLKIVENEGTKERTIPVSATINAYTVTPSGDGNEAFTPSMATIVNHGATQSFAVTANAGYTVASGVSGTCPTGSWNGNIYTTGSITSDCTVNFSAEVLVAASPVPPTLIPVTPVTATASSTYQTNFPVNIFDGNVASDWNAGSYAAWIEVDLGAVYDVKLISLSVSQWPAGNTNHQIYAGTTVNPTTLYHQFSGYTASGMWIQSKPDGPPSISSRYIRIVTTSTPSWVAWSEIIIYR